MSEITTRMTVEMESWLKTEKRPGQSEVDRWKAIYEKLFPGSPIPSPCKSFLSISSKSREIKFFLESLTKAQILIP